MGQRAKPFNELKEYEKRGGRFMNSLDQKSESVPKFLFPLFWEYDPESIRLRRHAHLVMARVMEWGNWRAMNWLGKAYSKQELISFLRSRGRKVLPPRELNYWALVSGVSNKERQKWIMEARDRHHGRTS